MVESISRLLGGVRVAVNYKRYPKCGSKNSVTIVYCIWYAENEELFKKLKSEE